MRLLTREEDGTYSLHTFYRDPPVYVILSHRWEAEEPTYQDIVNKTTPLDTPGWRKLKYCADYTAALDLSYFWVDTVCIDKTSSAELTEAINSMFRWYAESDLCIVYMSDVHTNIPTTSLDDLLRREEQYREENDNIGDLVYRQIGFQKSAWFTRGWTLQELLAPSTVLFFSSSMAILGNRISLEQQIIEATDLPAEVLRGRPLHEFSKEVRLSWAKGRETARDEDMAYCLMGIFDITMPVIYGEGKARALRRLEADIDRESLIVQKSLTRTSSDSDYSEGTTSRSRRAQPAERAERSERVTTPMKARGVVGGDDGQVPRGESLQSLHSAEVDSIAESFNTQFDPDDHNTAEYGAYPGLKVPTNRRKNCFGKLNITNSPFRKKVQCKTCGWRHLKSRYSHLDDCWIRNDDGHLGRVSMVNVQELFHDNGNPKFYASRYESYRCFLCDISFLEAGSTSRSLQGGDAYRLLQDHLQSVHKWSHITAEADRLTREHLSRLKA